MDKNVSPKEAVGHVLDAFDDTLLRTGTSNEAIVELLHHIITHAATNTDGTGPRSATELRWATYSRAAMNERDEHVAVLTLVVDRSGVIRPMVSTKNMPDIFAETIRTIATDTLANACSAIFQKPFRCGCRTCESGKAKELRDALEAGRAGWSQTKAEA